MAPSKSFFYQRKYPQLQELADYCLHRYLPEAAPGDYQALLDMAVANTAKMIALWQSFGFNHGVMNTDNMSIIGETFDFGPYAFLDDYDPKFICNHSDHHGRYSFEQQPNIGLWNLNALAHALSTLMDQDQLRESLMAYQKQLANNYQESLNRRLGLGSVQEADVALAQQWLKLLNEHKLDYNLSFRALATWLRSGEWTGQFEALANSDSAKQWLNSYQQRIEKQCASETAQKMDSYNPLYLPRTHHLQAVIEASRTRQRSAQWTKLFQCIQQPFKRHEDDLGFDLPPKDGDKGLCLSCSS